MSATLGRSIGHKTRSFRLRVSDHKPCSREQTLHWLQAIYSYTSKKVHGRKNRKHTVKDSDWKTYYGSCKALTADIELYGKDLFTREVLRICYNRFELTYYEAKYQFDLDVLLKPDQYYNGNILRAVFTPK